MEREKGLKQKELTFKEIHKTDQNERADWEKQSD